MIGKIVFLAAIALIQGRSQDADIVDKYQGMYELYDGCPPIHSHYLIPHEYDCTKFYYCEYGLKWTEPRICAPGTEFSAELQVCIHPILANCTLPGYSTTEETTTEVTDPPTTTTEVTTTTAAPTTTTAPTTTAAPTTTQAPTTTPAPTTTEATTTTQAPTTTEAITTTQAPTTTPAPTTTEATTTTQAPTTTEAITTTQAPTTTPAPTTTEATTTTQAPTTTEATTTTQTPTTTEATTTTQAPTTTEATTTTQAPTTTEATTTTQAPTTTSAPTTTPTLTTLPNGCPSDFDVHQLLPHESDCAKFYYCVFGEKVERSCAPGTLFNSKLQVCDWPENVDCVSNGNNPEPEDNGTLPNGCPSDFDVHQLLPHESDCDKFYYCVFGERVERSCAPGTLFNPELQVCDWPQNVNCSNSGGGDNGNGSGNCNGGSNCPGGGDGNGDNSTDNDEKCRDSCNVPAWAHDTDCDKFYTCEGQNAVLVTCSEGLHFNAYTRTCDYICNAGCVRENVQATASAEGIKVFLPWDKVDSKMRKVLDDIIDN